MLRAFTTCAGRRQRRCRRRAFAALRQAGLDPTALDVRINGAVDIAIADSARLQLASGVTLTDCRIELGANAEVSLGADVVLEGASLTVGADSAFEAGRGVHIARTPPFPVAISVRNGRVTVAEEATVRGSMLVRYGGRVHIGVRTFINHRTDIRCDTDVHIGDFTMISYDVHIGDTNSHCLDWRHRHEAIAAGPAHTLTDEPHPKAAPVRIGDDCWIGKRASILKGVDIGDRAIVGAAAVVTSDVPAETVAAGNPATHRAIDLSEAHA